LKTAGTFEVKSKVGDRRKMREAIQVGQALSAPKPVIHWVTGSRGAPSSSSASEFEPGCLIAVVYRETQAVANRHRYIIIFPS
jgi:hypothetical protein